MILGDGSAHLEIRVTDVGPALPPHSAGGDVQVFVRVRCGEFARAMSGWVERETWQDFVRQLGQLDGRGQREAVVKGMSPDELRLRVFATDRASHMAVEDQGSLPIVA